MSKFVVNCAMIVHAHDETRGSAVIGHLVGMLYIVPFGFKLTDVNLIQAGVFSAVSFAVARTIYVWT